MGASNFVTPQAVASPTFRPPPLHGTLTLPEIYDFHLRENGSHPLFVYDGSDGDIHTIHWRRAVQAIHMAGRLVQTSIGAPDENTGSVVGILAVVGEQLYFSASTYRSEHGIRPVVLFCTHRRDYTCRLLRLPDIAA